MFNPVTVHPAKIGPTTTVFLENGLVSWDIEGWVDTQTFDPDTAIEVGGLLSQAGWAAKATAGLKKKAAAPNKTPPSAD